MSSLFTVTLLFYFLSFPSLSQSFHTRSCQIRDPRFSQITRVRGSHQENNDRDHLPVPLLSSKFTPNTEQLKNWLAIAATAAYCNLQPFTLSNAMAADGVQLGMALFRNGDVTGSIKEFDIAMTKNPNLAAYMWQRGLSLYYAERYAEGSKQFRYDIAANPSDAEEIIWTIMCESKLQGFSTALANMPLLPKTDRRPIMRAVYDMFRGKTDEKVLSDLGEKTGIQNSSGDYFYSRLYLSLYREAKGDAEASKQFMKDAVASYYGQASSDYMTSVARVHLASR